MGENESSEMMEEKKENNKLQATRQQIEMMKDLPVTIQNKVDKFCNREKLCCYLCRRQFKTVQEVSDHINLSQFHLFNLSKWISAKRIEINNVAAKFYSSIASNSISTTNKQ